jgi:hypothetical protein
MNATGSDSTVYDVRITSKLDRPEERDGSYPVLPAGSYLRFEECTTSYRKAVELYRQATGGEWDFSSEFAIRTEVVGRDSITGRTWTVRRPGAARQPQRALPG